MLIYNIYYKIILEYKINNVENVCEHWESKVGSWKYKYIY